MLRTLTAFVLLQLSFFSHAACDRLVQQVSAELHYPDSTSSDRQSFSDCKVLPSDPGKTIVVLARFQEGSSFTSPASDMGLYDLDILLVQTRNGEVLSRLFQKGALSSDAIELDKITIDTARYDLAHNVRAFGIRTHFHHPSHYNPYESESLKLYTASGKGIRLVLDTLQTVDSGGERGECEGRYSDMRRTLAIGKTASHGYADLVITTKTIASETKMIGDECVENKASPEVSQETLEYDGNIYPHAMQ